MNKRFTRDEHTGYLYDNGEIVEDVMKLLNALNDENEQLKFQLDECQNHKLYSRRELEKENEQLRHDATILIQSNQDYRKENEELKQQLKELKEDVPLLLAFYRWYPFAVEKKEHQAYNRLWDFVND